MLFEIPGESLNSKVARLYGALEQIDSRLLSIETRLLSLQKKSHLHSSEFMPLRSETKELLGQVRRLR